MSSEIAIKVENLSKCYQIYDQPHDRLKKFILPRLQGMVGQSPKQYFQEFWALKDVSFEVKKGEVMGIIGRNGSGKSTLLQMICGTIAPTDGKVIVRGRIGALLELGSGFNPEFTGRENIYLNAMVLGLSHAQIDEYFDKILAFADIGTFTDQPVKTYSSGMVARLAFAVQAMIDPDVLIVDEALSVGDAKFQAKCFERLRHLKDHGTSILLVTHSDAQIVTHCSNALLLDGGRNVAIGVPKQIVNRYMDLLFGKDIKEPEKVAECVSEKSAIEIKKINSYLSSADDVFASHPCYNEYEYRWGDKSATILDFYLEANGKSYPTAIKSGQLIILSLAVKFHADIIRPILGFTIKTKEGVIIYGVNSETLDIGDIKSQGHKDSVIFINITFDCLLATGDYFVSLGVASMQGETIIPHDRRYDSIHLQVSPIPIFFGLANLNAKLNVMQET